MRCAFGLRRELRWRADRRVVGVIIVVIIVGVASHVHAASRRLFADKLRVCRFVVFGNYAR